MLKCLCLSAKHYHKRDIHGHKLMVVDLCLINISAPEQISSTDQPHTWYRKGIAMKNQVLMNVRWDSLIAWPVCGGMKVEKWGFFIHTTNWGDITSYGCDILCSTMFSHSYFWLCTDLWKNLTSTFLVWECMNSYLMIDVTRRVILGTENKWI